MIYDENVNSWLKLSIVVSSYVQLTSTAQKGIVYYY